MAVAPKDGTKDVQEIPESWDADQLFVAVSDRGGEVAGEDGGPRNNGRGMWYVGNVGRWTSHLPVPLALRDPVTGLIWKGYLEPVTNVNGQYVPTSYFAENPGTPARKQTKASIKASKPSEGATSRAKHGPGKLAALVRPEKPTAARIAARNAGLATE